MGLNFSFWKNRRVLITGHTGFKGCWLSLFLKELGADVTGFALKPSHSRTIGQSLSDEVGLDSRLGKNNQWIGDICDAYHLSKFIDIVQPEIVFHLAAQSLVRTSYLEPIETWKVNVQGSLQLLESLKNIRHQCAVVMVTTDKVYQNQEWIYPYREVDPLGGHDPYSASKAAVEIAIDSWRKSFCGEQPHQTRNLQVATARAGNVIGGGDWCVNRIIPDAIEALYENKIINLRNPNATRPWQHVLDPLKGYIQLAEKLWEIATTKQEELLNNTQATESTAAHAFNFGPENDANRTVAELINEVFKSWPGESIMLSRTMAYMRQISSD